MRVICAALLIMATAGCDSRGSDNLVEEEPFNVSEYLTTENVVANDITAVDGPTEASVQPERNHFYEFKEGDVYGYVAAISEEDQKKGKAAPDVVTYRYKGYWNDVHHLEQVDDAGRILSVSECSEPCSAIKIYQNGGVQRLAFTTNSIIGAAFDDAIRGRLVDARKLEQATQPRAEAAAERNPFDQFDNVPESEAVPGEANAAE